MDLQHKNRALREKKLGDFLDICLETEDLKDNEELNYIKKVVNATKYPVNPEESKILPGQDILVTGYMGQLGADIMSRFERDRMSSRLPEPFMDKALTGTEAYKRFCALADFLSVPENWDTYGITYSAVISESGMYKNLYDLGKVSGIGFTVNYPEVPIKQATVEFCEIVEADPWEMFTGNSVIIVCDRGPALKRKIEEQTGCNCELCGYMTKGKDKFIAHKDQMSRVNRPKPDALLTILKERFLEDSQTSFE